MEERRRALEHALVELTRRAEAMATGRSETGAPPAR